LLHDLGTSMRLALRSLVRRPALTLTAVLSLALGVGANTAVFTLVNAFFLQALPVAQPARLAAIYATHRAGQGAGGAFLPISWPDARDYAAQSRAFAGILLNVPLGLSVEGKTDTEMVLGDAVSANYFDVLGVRLLRGRGFTAAEAAPGSSLPVVVVGDGLWRRRFGADPALVGRTVRINRRVFTVVGIAPPGFRGLDRTSVVEAWVPFGMFEALAAPEIGAMVRQRDGRLMSLVGRLGPGVQLPQAQAEMTAIAGRLAREYPDADGSWGVTLLPLTSFFGNPQERDTQLRARTLMAGTVGLVLLIACINVANLLMVRASERQSELAIRLSMGAGRWRLVRQLLIESLLLAVAGGACGLGVAAAGVRFLWSIRPPQFVENALDLRPDAAVLAFTLAVSLLSGLAFGLLPALRASRTDLVSSLKSGATRGSGRRAGTLRRVLVAGQLSLCLVCLICGGLFLRSLRKAAQVDPGFDTRGLMLATMVLPREGYDEPHGRQFLHQLVERLGALPGVQSVSFASTRLLIGLGVAYEIAPEGQRTGQAAGHDAPLIRAAGVGDDYFHTLGVPILRGRAFGAGDRLDSRPVAIVNEKVARQLWPGQDALGKRFHLDREAQPIEIVGIARDVRNTSLQAPPVPFIYLPAEQRYSSMVTVYVHASPGELTRLTGEMRRQVHELDPALPLLGHEAITESIAVSLWAPRLATGLLGFFGVLALVLACVGVYGVMAGAVEQRRTEIGLRVALGARHGDILRLVLGEAARVIGAGLALGLAGAALAGRLTQDLLYGVDAYDPPTVAALSLSLAVVALLASSLPARRALRTDPLIAMRSS